MSRRPIRRPSPTRTPHLAGAAAAFPTAVAILGLALAVGGCAPGGSEATSKQWNVVVILVDTLRADHVSLFGYHRETTPTLHALGRESYVFPNTQSQAGCTFPSVNSVMTSRYPAHFGGDGDKVSYRIPESLPSIAEILTGQGYDSAAVSASSVVRATPSHVNHEGGYDRGFRTFDEACLMRSADCVNARTLPLLDELSQPFFLYLHYWDPHGPYNPPVHHVPAFSHPPEVSYPWLLQGNLWPIRRKLYDGEEGVEILPRDLETLRVLYDEEIRYWDSQLKQLLAWLDERQLLDRTILVFLSDHGEEILDHDEIGHCRDIAYQTTLDTPMLIRIPGHPGGVVEALAQNLDILPTVLDYLGFSADDLGLEGTSLRPTIEAGREVNRYAFSSQGKHRAVTDGRYKLLYNIDTEELRLFDLRTDPGETRDVSAAEPDLATELREVLFRWILHLEGAVGSEESIQRARDVEQQLKAVGYL